MSNLISSKAENAKNSGSGKGVKDGMNGSGVFSACGFTGNSLGLPLSKP